MVLIQLLPMLLSTLEVNKLSKTNQTIAKQLNTVNAFNGASAVKNVG